MRTFINGNMILKKKHKPSPWDRLVEQAYDSVQERFNETVETALEEDSMGIEEAEDKVFEAMKPIYRSALMARYQDLVYLCLNSKRVPTHKKVLATTNRPRDDKEYDEEEAVKYAFEKKRYFLERKLDEYDRPSYVAEENGADTLIPVKTPPAAVQTIQRTMNMS